MRKRLLAFLLAFVLACSGSTLTFAKGSDPEKDPGKQKAIEKLNGFSGGDLRLDESGGRIFLSGKLSGSMTAGEQSARQFLEEYKALFGIRSAADELQAAETIQDETGDTFVRFIQSLKGIKVEGGGLTVHFDKDGAIVSVNGMVLKDKRITRLGDKAISMGNAMEIAKRQFDAVSLRAETKAEEVIVAEGKKNYAAYKVNVAYTDPDFGNFDVYVEATSGKVLKTESNIRYDGPATGTGVDVQGVTRNLNLYQSGSTYQMMDYSRPASSMITTYQCNNGTSTGYLVNNTTNFFNTEYFKASVSAHYFAGKVIDFYKILFDRNSLDNKNMGIDSFTHYSVGYNNAFWDGYEMIYGDGDGSLFTYLSGDLDVVGHEMTHGVIDYTADMVYHNQPGALNESMADVFGVLIETYDKYVAPGGSWTFNPADWVVGDQIYTPGVPGDALRSLADPGICGQPGNMSEYVMLPDTEEGDWGGVHTNSGIPNKAAYLIAEYVGMEKTARIYYRALVFYMGVNSDFADAKNCLLQSATDLYGVSSAEATAVTDAFSAVGVDQPPIQDPYEPNDTISTAYPVTLDTLYQSYIASAGDIDLYRFTADETGAIVINLTDIPQNCDYDLYLFSQSGDELAYSLNYDQYPEQIVYDVPAPGDYYIDVEPYIGYSTAQMYSLVVSKPAAVTGVTLDQHLLSLYKGESVTLVATVQPPQAFNKAVTWSSSNSAVASVNSAGKVTAAGNGSATITAMTVDGGFTDSCTVNVATLLAPASPRAVSYAYNAIRVSWAASAGASGYEVYRATSSTGAYTLAGTTASTSLANTGLATNAAYYFKVRAYRGGSPKVYSAWSAVVSARPVPAAPASISADPTSYSSVRIVWSAVAGASGYELYRATSSGGAYTRLATTTAVSYVNTGLRTGSPYYYKVRAYRTVSGVKVYGPYSAVDGARPTLGVPSTVRAYRASASSIKVTWGAVSGASGYELWRSTSSAGTYVLVKATTALNYTNAGLTTGKWYYYKVRAYRMVGSTKVYGAFSAYSAAKP